MHYDALWRLNGFVFQARSELDAQQRMLRLEQTDFQLNSNIWFVQLFFSFRVPIMYTVYDLNDDLDSILSIITGNIS